MVLVTQLGVAEVDESVNPSLVNRFRDQEPNKTIIRQIVYTLKNSPLLKNEKVKKYIDTRAGVFIFDVIISGQNYVAKVIVDFGLEYPKCRNEKAFEDRKSKNVRYVSALENYDEYKGSDRLTSFYS